MRIKLENKIKSITEEDEYKKTNDLQRILSKVDNFPTATMEVRSQWNCLFNLLKANTCQY